MKTKALMTGIAAAALSFATGYGLPATAADRALVTAVTESTDYPKKTLTMLVEHGAGGSVDTGVRLYQPYLAKELGVNVVVKNVVGAGGNVGRQQVYEADPDGYLLLNTFQPSMSMGQLINNGKFDNLKFTPVYGLYGGNPQALVVSANSPHKTIEDLLGAKGKTLTMSIVGVGNNSWLATMLLITDVGLNVKPVPFKTGQEAINAAVGGHVDLGTTNVSTVARLVKDGQGRVLATMSTERDPLLPDVPTLVEKGFPNAFIEIIMGVYAPPGTPRQVVDRLAKAFDNIVKNEDFKKRAKAAGFEGEPMGPAAFAKATAANFRLAESIIPKVKEYLPKKR